MVSETLLTTQLRCGGCSVREGVSMHGFEFAKSGVLCRVESHALNVCCKVVVAERYCAWLAGSLQLRRGHDKRVHTRHSIDPLQCVVHLLPKGVQLHCCRHVHILRL